MKRQDAGMLAIPRTRVIGMPLSSIVSKAEQPKAASALMRTERKACKTESSSLIRKDGNTAGGKCVVCSPN